MNSNEAAQIQQRLAKFESLTARHGELNKLFHAIANEGKDPVHKASPFTGNTRESRRVDRLMIAFSRTLGGGEPVTIHLEALNINAGRFRVFLEAELQKELDALNKQIEEL